MDVITYQKTYQEYKKELDGELQKTAEGFVKIGYLLKVARDTNVLAESGYKTVSEFAEAEYNLNKTQVSRFMSINDRFSEGGYSEKLMKEYQGFGYAKLTIMLQLPDSLNEELSPNYSKNEIQAIRDELAEEENVSDIERLIESPNPNESNCETVDTSIETLCKAILQLGEEDPNLYVDVCAAVSLNKPLIETMAPAGEKVYSIRVRGVGRLMLIISEMSEEVKLVNSRSGEKLTYTWDDVIAAWKYAGITEEDAAGEEMWEKRYERKFPKAAVAPVQQINEKRQEPKKKKKKESRVSKAPKEKNKEDLKQNIQPTESNEIPGQTNIVDDFPQYMPEPDDERIEENAEEQQEPKIIENTEAETVSEVAADTTSNVERGYKAAITNNLNMLNELWNGTNENKINLMIDTLKDLEWRLEKLQEVQNG